MSHFEANLALLEIKQPDLAQQLRHTACSHVRIAASASGSPTATYDSEGSSKPLHSRYNPLREAQQTLKQHDCEGADYFIFLGFGLGYLLDAVIAGHAHPSNHYFIVESDLEILRAAFESRDLTSLLSGHNIYFAWPASGPELASQWQKQFDPVLARKSIFIAHPPSAALHLDQYKAAAEMIQSQIHQTFTDINTLVAQSQTFLDNFVKNMPKAAKAPGVEKYRGQFSGIPAIIVSAGPSLDKNIHELRGYEDRVLILSTDTALKPLLAAGVAPHFVLTGDPAYANYLHLKGATAGESLLVTEATSFPSVFDDFAGRVIACTYERSALQPLSDLIGDKGILRAWGSVATMALDFALLLDCNPVIFVGQDLAHTDGRIYCSGVYFEQEWFQGITDPDGYQARLVELRSQRTTTTVEDIFGRPVESTDKLTAYWNWMVKVIDSHPEVHFINATEGGILRGSVEILSLRETLYRFGSVTRDLRERIDRIFCASAGLPPRNIAPMLDQFLYEFESLQNALNKGLDICQKAVREAPASLGGQLEEIKRSLYGHKRLAPLLDTFNQMGNVAFLRKNHEISRQPQTEGQVLAIKDMYAEYFASVRDALAKIGPALQEMKANLNAS